MKIAAVAPSVNRPKAEHSRPVEAHAPSAGLTRSAVDDRIDDSHFSRSSDE